MAKSKKQKSKSKKQKKMTTEKALESLLGRKAAKRLRRLATEIAETDAKIKKGHKAKSA